MNSLLGQSIVFQHAKETFSKEEKKEIRQTLRERISRQIEEEVLQVL